MAAAVADEVSRPAPAARRGSSSAPVLRFPEMEPIPLTAEEKLQLAFEMHELGCAMMRQTLLRRFPHETDAERERRFVEWLHTRPGAEHGDAPGRSRPLP